MCDVLLIQPIHEKVDRKKTYPTGPPLGLGYMASVLVESGFDVKILDMNIHASSSTEVQDILKIKPSIIGVSVNTPSLPHTYTLLNELRGEGFGGEVVLGGPHLTSQPKSIIKLGCRYGFRGESDFDFERLCGLLIRKEGCEENIKNLFIKEGGCLKFNENKTYSDLDSIPTPNRDMFEMGKYDFIQIVASRGCPYKCIYCSMAGTKYRKRDSRLVVDEVIEVSRKYPNSMIGFSDDILTFNQGFVEDMCDILIRRESKVKWSCTTRADLVNEKLIKKMRLAGCWHMSFGVESGVEDIRYEIGKNIPNQTYKDVFNVCDNYGVITRAYIMFGHPNESLKEMVQTINFTKELKPKECCFSLTSIYPGTGLAAWAIKNNIINEDVWEENMVKGLGAPVYLPEGVAFKDIEKILLLAVKTLKPTPIGAVKEIIKRLIK